MTENKEYILSILSRFGFQKIRRSRNGYTALCKFHDNTNTPAFSISDKGLWMCFSCGEKGNLKQLITRLGGDLSDWREVVKLLGAQTAPQKQIKVAKSFNGVMPPDFKTYTQIGRVPPVILDRLKWETIEYFGLGASEIDKNKDRCIIPVRYRGKNVCYHGRALNDDMVPKYYNSPGVDIKEFLFNYDECESGEEVIVTEGAFNAMSMWEKGFPHTVATFGTKFTSSQVNKIFKLAPSSIVICFDRDTRAERPGQKAAMSLASLTHQLIDTYIMPLPKGMDPNNLSEDVLNVCYDKRIKYDDILAARGK